MIQARLRRPNCHKFPYAFGVSAVHYKMISRFHKLATQNTRVIVRPTTCCESVCRPDSILGDEPCEKIAFG
jgi:hypothetical protein